MKKYQKAVIDTPDGYGADGCDAAAVAELVVPERVNVAMGRSPGT